ncbi:MAG: helix-hairpin-helix domain-containing protein [Lachnospiraceae bacterium]|nr:helix-hairpin-helix domain-containing protein [Lachnospiraceae bacterium]
MLGRKKGLAAALLCVALIEASGCARSGSLYTAGLTVETETYAEESDSADGGAEREIADAVSVPGGAEAALPSAETETEAVLGYVYVCGAVKVPGVYPIRGDMRVCDAIALAGGFSAEADEEWLNQAAVVNDGQKLYVYSVEETDQMKLSGLSSDGKDAVTSGYTGAASDESDSAGGTAPSGDGSSDISGGKVNLNTATAEELMTLPGIGESKAAAILAYRSEHGSFASIEEIQNISGIKSGVFSKIKDLITV